MGDKGKILVVDDEKLILSTLQYKLTKQGYQVALAENGQEALKSIKTTEYDLVLLDVKLWDINGITILEKIKAVWPDTVVIMITGHASLDGAIKAMRGGAYDYLLKPISDQELKIRVERGMEKRRALLEKKALQQQIAESRRLLLTTFDGLVDGLVLLDQEHNILYLNKSSVSFRNINFTGALGKRYCTALWNAEKECVNCPIKNTILTGQRGCKERGWQRGKKEKLIVELTTYPVLDQEGNVLQVIVYERNLTAEKRLMDQLIISEKLAELGRMAAAIGHELNNYLNGISLRVDWIPQLLQRGEQERALSLIPEVKGYLTEIGRFARGLVEAGQTTPQVKECNLNGIIQKTISFLKPQNAFDGIEFTQKLDTRIPNVCVDTGQIEQVLINLFNNAAEAMGKGEISISTKALPKNDCLELSVKDNGSGIPKAHLADIFKPYFTTKKGGHGLGLAICYNIIKAHKGTITVNSEPVKGTTFNIRLPINRGS